MKKKTITILFIANSLLLLAYFMPVLVDIYQVSFCSDAASIGIIGGEGGMTTIFVSSKMIFFPIAIISIEVILGGCLLISYFRK